MARAKQGTTRGATAGTTNRALWPGKRAAATATNRRTAVDPGKRSRTQRLQPARPARPARPAPSTQAISKKPAT
jgi:hypothetical protein